MGMGIVSTSHRLLWGLKELVFTIKCLGYKHVCLIQKRGIKLMILGINCLRKAKQVSKSQRVHFQKISK